VGEHVHAGGLEIWTDQVGQGPDVLLIGGAGDTVESWQFQLDGLADRYRLIAFDNRGAGRTAMPEGTVSAEMMADDAAHLLQAFDVASAHVAGFSGAASSPRSWRSVTRNWSAAWSCRAPGRCRMPTFAPGSDSRAGLSSSPEQRACLSRGILPRLYTARGAQRRDRRSVH
jgi:pimeloyl-ACP methyl ester carboxylesterase